MWKIFALSVLEQSCVLWDSGLTKENEKDLERTQKSFVRLILEEDYSTYEEALIDLGLSSLKLRRKNLILSFAKRSLADGHFSDLFPKRKPEHQMEIRKREKYQTTHANTNRFKNSPILQMQRLLNEELI